MKSIFYYLYYRNCNYPIEMIIKLEECSQIRELNILSHPFKTPETVQIYIRDSKSPNSYLY